ncbi:MAG: hypothetical protein Phog2KO_33640 [Phototrophicaceae bacterium]
MLIRNNQVQKEQLWVVVAGQALLLLVLSIVLLRVWVFASPRIPTQALSIETEPALNQDLLVAQAESRIANNNIVGGLALLDVTIQQGQPSARIFGARAAAYARIGDYANAIIDYEQATVLAPENGDYQFGLCFARVQAEDYQNSLLACGNAINIMPTHFMARNNRCYVRAYHVGDYAGAIEDCTQAIALDSTHPYPYNNRARAYMMLGSYQQAIADASQSIALGNPYDYLALTNRGTAYMASGDANAALNDFSVAIQSNADYDEVYARLGELYRWQNQPELARQSYCHYMTITDVLLQVIIERINELGGCE